MPELPEVEFCRRRLIGWIKGRLLTEVTVGAHHLPNDSVHQKALSSVCGKRLLGIGRHGKHLFLEFDGLRLWCHLAMTGKFVRRDVDETPRRFERFVFRFDEVTVSFIDTRKLGAFEVIPDPEFADWMIRKALGPDVFDPSLNVTRFWEYLRPSTRSIKAILLDQKIIAGVGNIYACEALFQSQIDPTRPAQEVREKEAELLFYAIRRVMEDSLDREDGQEIAYLNEGGTKNPFMVYGRKGVSCGGCGNQIVRIVQQGRSTYFCPTCQR